MEIDRAESQLPVKLLVVDDEPRGTELMQRVLHPLGEVLTANSVADARRVMELHTIDLVLSDERMPSDSGVDLLAEIAEKHPLIGRILITAYSDLDRAIDAINRGQVHAYLNKPCTPAHMKLTVESVLERVRLARNNQELVRDLEERNQRLTKATRLLREAQRNSEADSQLKSNFLKNVTDELRDPLTSILSFSKLLADPALEEPQRASVVEDCISSASMLLTRLQDIRRIAEAESGDRQIELASFPLVDLIAELERSLGPRASQAHIELRFAASPELVEIESDPALIKQLLFYLAEHALRSTQSPQVELHFRPNASTMELEIEIRDVHPEAAERQPDTPNTLSSVVSTAARADLAFFIGQQICHLLGGRLEIGDANDRRVHVRAILPLRPELPPASKQQSSGPGHKTAPCLLDARVLILSANRIEQRVLASILRRAGGSVEIATTSDEASALISATRCSSQQYTAVVIDTSALGRCEELYEELQGLGYAGLLIALGNPAQHPACAGATGSAERHFDAILARPVERDAVLELVARLADSRPKRPRA